MRLQEFPRAAGWLAVVGREDVRRGTDSDVTLARGAGPSSAHLRMARSTAAATIL